MKKTAAYIVLAGAAFVTVWTVGALATTVSNNIEFLHRSPLSLSNTNVPLMVMTLIGLAILILIGRFLFDNSRLWLKVFGGFLACLGLFIVVVHTAFPVSLRIDIRAFLSVQAYTLWIGLGFAVLGGLLFLLVKVRKGR